MWDRAEKGMCLLLSRKMGSGSRAPLLLVGRLFPAASGCHMSSEEGTGPQMALGVPSGVREISRVLGPVPGHLTCWGGSGMGH